MEAKPEKKPEHMTRLFGDRMVPKTNGRIVFRGLVDSLEADVIEAQILAYERGGVELCNNLGEVLDYLRTMMAAEVKEIPLSPPFIFGMDDEEIRRRSNSISYNSLPSYTEGALAARLNSLRAKIREVEIYAVKAFGPDAPNDEKREDIILALNRLSSAMWWLFCKLTDEHRQ